MKKCKAVKYFVVCTSLLLLSSLAFADSRSGGGTNVFVPHIHMKGKVASTTKQDFAGHLTLLPGWGKGWKGTWSLTFAKTNDGYFDFTIMGKLGAMTQKELDSVVLDLTKFQWTGYAMSKNWIIKPIKKEIK